ncbi:hypothetical protein ACHAWF_007981 [Thalassiosira exigua]
MVANGVDCGGIHMVHAEAGEDFGPRSSAWSAPCGEDPKRDDGLAVDPLLKYLRAPRPPSERPSCFDVDAAVEALTTDGYYHIPSVLTPAECAEALDELWDFVEDVSGGIVHRSDPRSWYPRDEVEIAGEEDGNVTAELPGAAANGVADRVPGDGRAKRRQNEERNGEDWDPWPHTGYGSFPDMFQSLGAGFALGRVRELVAERVYEPLFGTRELRCSKEGFTFARPLVVDLGERRREESIDSGNGHGNKKGTLLWRPKHLVSRPAGDENDGVMTQRPLFRVCGKPQSLSEGQHYDQGVPASALKRTCSNNGGKDPNSNGPSKKQQNRDRKERDKRRRYKDLTGLCHVQASISFADQTRDEGHGGGHFLCHPGSHSAAHRDLVGGTYRATPAESSRGGKEKERLDPTWVPVTDEEIRRLGPAKRIYARKGDVILWRSDLVHAGVAPSRIAEEGGDCGTNWRGPRGFRAVGYCAMLPDRCVEEYLLCALPRRRVTKSIVRGETLGLDAGTTAGSWTPDDGRRHKAIGMCGDPVLDPGRVRRVLEAEKEALHLRKLESYCTGRTGDHRPDVEAWHEHRRKTLWNAHACRRPGDSRPGPLQMPFPPRMLQRPRHRLGPPALTVRQAELYGLLPYASDDRTRRRDIERAVIRGVRFEEGVYKCRDVNGGEVGPWRVRDGKFCSEPGDDALSKVDAAAPDVPICLAGMEVLTCSANGASMSLAGQDKYLGGMASPCGRYVYGVTGHAKRVVRVDVRSGAVDFVGPEFPGEFKWLRGVEVPASVMGRKDDGDLAHPSGCCLALPCNSKDGCVLKIDPESSRVTTFVTGPPIPNVEEGWLYHGGNLSSDGYVYAIPASAPRVMKIDPRLETTEYIGPEFPGKAKWYGGIEGCDGCIYGIPHNATGVLKINPGTQEVTVLAEGSLTEGLWKWHGGLASSDGSKIIGFPNNADSVLVVDVPKQAVYTVGDSSVLRSGYHRIPQDGRYKYLGGALSSNGKLAYLFPCDAEYVLRFDMKTDEIELVGPHLTEGENKFQNGFVGSDGAIYGIPQRASGVLRIIPPGVKRYGSDERELPNEREYVDVMYCGDDMVSCKDKFEGGVLGMDGKIYCIPLRAKAFVNIVPANMP